MSTSYLPKIKILCADDRPENLLALQAVFRDNGYEIFEAHSGKEALELARYHDFACIILDVQMPILDGFQTAQAIRNIPRSQFTPIIFVTAIHRTEQYEEMGYVAGAIDYLFKPLNPMILKAKVSVFVDLFLQSEEIKQKNALLEEAILRKKENEELKRSLKIRDDFLAMAGHELKTPLTPLYLQLQSFTMLFESGTVDKVPPERLLRMLRTSTNQLERLTNLISELVNVSKLSANKLDLNRTETCLVELVRKVLADFEVEIKRANCTVSYEGPDVVNGYWDGPRIEQVLVNLLTNALKYGSGKPIRIIIGRYSENVYLSVRDHGIGIPQEHQQRIFEKFERAVSNDSFNGLGLGLFIAKEIVGLHRGRIWVESSPGQGSTFYVSLPVSVEAIV